MRIFSKLRERRFSTVLRVDQERLTLSRSRDSPSTVTRRKKDFRLLVLVCLVFAQPLGGLSQWIDEGEFSRAVLADKLRQLKSQFEQVEAELLVRGRAESKLKKLELEDLYTRIKRLETEFQRGGYYPDLLDEQIVIVREDLRLILADPGQTGTDQNRADGQSQRMGGTGFWRVAAYCSVNDRASTCPNSPTSTSSTSFSARRIGYAARRLYSQDILT